MRFMHLFSFFFYYSLLLSSVALPFHGDGWDWIPDLPLLSAIQFKDIAYPLVQISANAYRYPACISIPGWKIVSSPIPPLAPSHGGAHAILYQEDDEDSSGRLILAFRGTQMSPTLDSLADICADKILWEDKRFSDLPLECRAFNESTLDYYTQAVSYTTMILDAYPGKSLLLTGHSLGAGLAILVSASLSGRCILPVIGFGPTGTQLAMARRSLHLKAQESRKIFGIAHEWDEVVRSQWYDQVGMLCLYEKPLSASCRKCFSNNSAILREGESGRVRSLGELKTISGTEIMSEELHGKGIPKSGYCLRCFFETHYLKQLIQVVKQGNRPICEQR